MSMRKMYLHLIDGRPGYFSPHDEQIVLMENSAVWRDELGKQALRRTRRQILRDQIVTRQNRKSWGFEDAHSRYGYAIVSIPEPTAVKTPRKHRVLSP